MGQYIDKAAVVAKIERLQDAHKDQMFRNLFTEEFIGGKPHVTKFFLTSTPLK